MKRLSNAMRAALRVVEAGGDRRALEREPALLDGSALKPGDRALWGDQAVDVLRVYRTTATVQGWGRNLSEGKLVTWRGIGLDQLRPFPPRRWTLDGEPVDLHAFLADNPDLDALEVAHLRNLQPGQEYRGGGGAQPEWVIRREPVE